MDCCQPWRIEAAAHEANDAEGARGEPAARGTVAQPIVDCLAQARRPSDAEIEHVAARIWTDVRGRGSRKADWHNWQMIAFSRAALGLEPASVRAAVPRSRPDEPALTGRELP